MKISLALLAALFLTYSVCAQTPSSPVVFGIDPNGHVSGTVTLIPGPPGPPGTPGTDGKDGSAATVTVGTTTTGAPGTPASVTNSGTPNAAVLNFTIPKGDTGAPGPPSPSYPGVTSDGANGLAITGKVTTKEVDTNGPPPNQVTVGSQVGITGAITLSKPTCKLTVTGGIITGASGC